MSDVLEALIVIALTGAIFFTIVLIVTGIPEALARRKARQRIARENIRARTSYLQALNEECTAMREALEIQPEYPEGGGFDDRRYQK